MVELAPICREDLVMLPKSLSKELGGIGPIVLVYKISKFIHIVDINSMQTFEVDGQAYWKTPFRALLTRERLTEFVVMDIENIDTNMNDSRAAIKQKFR
jgi:nonsense-mediated mRNA decay protein 3|tara:strand:- start:315 stop:611 length:297 start_codon:yes stop_codon:yes gene_type:complete